MYIESEVLRYLLSLLTAAAGGFRLHDWFGPSFLHAVRSYAVDLCGITNQFVCF